MKNILMIGTSPQTMGGIASVVKVYRAAGLFERFPILYLTTHCDGGKFKKIRTMVGAYAHFLGLLVLGRVDLIHVHTASRASFWRKSYFFLLAFAFRVPTILHLHGAEFAVFYEKECGSWRKHFVRYVFDNVTRLVVLSSAWKTWVEAMSANPHVLAIYNPVLFPEKANDWDKRKSGSILFLGRLGKRKGSYDLLDAAAQLAATHPGFRLLLGGDGELEQVRLRSSELGIADKVEFLGWVQGVDKERYLTESMIYVLPSYSEGLPMSILEAMAAGLPVVSTPIGGIPEAVTDGVEGFLVAPGDIAALSKSLKRLLADDGLAQRMGQAARKKVEMTFSSDAILPKLETLYGELGLLRIEPSV
jgi:glycosyltransferase involved in cell wall biosynthesis